MNAQNRRPCSPGLLSVGLLCLGLAVPAVAQEAASPPSPSDLTAPTTPGAPAVEMAAPPTPAAPEATPAPAHTEAIEEIDSPQIFTLWLNPDNYPRIERAVNVPNAQTTRARALNLLVDHRGFEPFQKHAFQDFMGFDAGGLKIGLQLRYGITDHLEVGAQRLSNGTDDYDTYQFDLKYWILPAASAFVDVAARAGGTWYESPTGPDSGGAFGQLLVSRSFREYLWLGTGLFYHSNASNTARRGPDGRRAAGQAYALAVPAALEVRLQTFLAFDAEACFNVAGYHAKYPVVSAALKFISFRHTFSLVFSNSQYIGADGLVANSERGIHELVFGFTITREFNF
jgi:hypothetical protein